MEFICLGPQTWVRECSIAQVIALNDLQDKSVLSKAKRESKLEALIGRPHRTAVYLYNGQVVLTPLSAKTIFAHIQKVTF